MSRHAATHRAPPGRRNRAADLIVLGTLICALGAGVQLVRSAEQSPSAASLGPAVQGPAQSPQPGGPAVRDVPPPTRLRIPSIGVDTSLQSLGLQSNGTMQAPSEWQVAGWFRDGVRPGDPGPAVIAGHIDSTSGPAVFYRLANLRAGDAVYVTRADDSVVRFVVDDIARYRKDSFPTAAVYGPQPLPVLRLITCTGDFDRSTHSYLDNLVVSAHVS